MKKKTPIDKSEQLPQAIDTFSDAFFVRVAKIKYPDYDYYVLVRDADPATMGTAGRRQHVALINGFEIAHTIPINLLWEAYQERTFNKQAVRELKLNGDEPERPQPGDLTEDVLKPMVRKYGADGAQLIVHFNDNIISASWELTYQQQQEGYCVGIYHLEKFARGKR